MGTYTKKGILYGFGFGVFVTIFFWISLLLYGLQESHYLAYMSVYFFDFIFYYNSLDFISGFLDGPCSGFNCLGYKIIAMLVYPLVTSFVGGIFGLPIDLYLKKEQNKNI